LTLKAGVTYSLFSFVESETDGLSNFAIRELCATPNTRGGSQFLEWAIRMGPGTRPGGPIISIPRPPGSAPDGCHRFPEVPSDLWYDPIPADGFEFTGEDDTKFCAINGFPSGFRAPFSVEVDGEVVGTFSPGQRCNFLDLLGAPVEKFRVTGISRPVDAEDPQAFPIRIEFEEPIGSFTMAPLQLEVSPDLTELSQGAEEYVYTFDGDFADTFTPVSPSITATQIASSLTLSGSGIGRWQSSEFNPLTDGAWSATLDVNLPVDLETTLGPGQAVRLGLQVADDLGNSFTATLGGSRVLVDDPVIYRYEVGTAPVADPAPLPAPAADGNGCIILHYDPATGVLTARNEEFATIFGLDLGPGGANWDLGNLTISLYAETLGGATLASTDPATLDNFAGVNGVALPLMSVIPAPDEGGTDVTWWGIKGYRYQLYGTDDLEEWTPLGSPFLGSENLLQVRDPELPSDRFFRLGVDR
jgi:hypothetical protein